MSLSLLLLAFADAAATSPPSASTAAAVVSVVASAASPGAAEDRRARTLAHLNAVRTAAGAGPLAASGMLALSASRHAGYLSDHGFRSAPSIHAESAGLAGFSGADPFVRMRDAGYRPSYATEVVGDIGLRSTDTDCVDHLMNTIYHAALMLGRVTEAGVAYGDGAAAGTCVMDLGAPLLPSDASASTSGGVVRYPSPGSTLATGTFRLASENPRPLPSALPGATSGIPVLVGLREAARAVGRDGPGNIEIQVFELRDAADVPVPAVVLADAEIGGRGVIADDGLHGAFAALVPRQPLPPGRYRVILRVALDATHVLEPDPWTFVVVGR